VQSGNVVTCSGATNTGFGTGAENNLSITVVPNASITIGAAQVAINVASGNTALNNGTIAAGDGGQGMQGVDNNSFTNTGTMTLGSGSTAMFMLGNNNALTNTGTISSNAVNALGFDVLGTGNALTNSGTIILTGTASYGMSANGDGQTIFNSGVITIGSATGTNGAGVFLLDNNSFTNTGTVTAAGPDSVGVSVWGHGNTVINRGTINASGMNGIALGIGDINNQIVNYGTIKGGPAGYSMFSFGTTGTVITNYGTLDGMMMVSGFGAGNTLTNAGLITITDSLTLLATGNIGISGTYTQTAQGTLALRVDNAGARDGLFAGNVNLNGTLRAVLQPGLYKSSTSYTNVVQSNTAITGQFSSVTSSSAFFNAVASYNVNSVDLTLTRYALGAVPGETANQRAVGNSLETGYSTSLTGAAATFYTRLLQAGSVRVLDQLSGEGTSGTQNTAFTAGALFGQTMDNQMNAWRAGNRGDVAGGTSLGYAEARPNAVTSAFNALKAPAMAQPAWHAWVAGFGAGESLSGDPVIGSAGFNDRVAGGAIGVDHVVGSNLLIGLAAGGSSGSFSVDERATSGRVGGGHVGAYAMQTFGASYLSAQVAYGHFNNTTTRFINGVGPTETATSSFGSDQLGGRIEIGHSFAFNPVTVTPFAALQAARLWQAAYTETSTAGGLPGVLGLSYAAHGVSSLPIFLGTKFDGRFDAGNGMLWMPFVHIAWVHEFEPTRDVTATLTTMALPTFTVEGARAAADAGRVELGSRLVLNPWWQLSARMTGEFSRAGESYAGIGSLRASW
jgi:uncharacterized protein with beta-barrel porin domain